MLMGMRLSRSIVGEAEADAVRRVICQDGYLGMGAATRQFEEELATYLGVEAWQIISVNSGTAALMLAVDAVKQQSQLLADCSKPPRILVPSLTFVASFQAIRAAACEPVACDVLLETGTIDLMDAERRLDDRVIALMHVDYASNPWHLDRVYEFASRHKLKMIDDAAHAFGCRYHGRKIGSFGELVCFSFDGIKNITCGEGGCLVAFDREAAQLAADARLLGVMGDSSKRFAGTRSWDPDVTRTGWRLHLSNIMAAIGSVQLSRLESEFIPARRRLYELYRDLLRDAPHLRFLETDPRDFIVPHILPVRILDNYKKGVESGMQAAGIPLGVHYKPNHLLSLFGKGVISLPNAEKLYHELVTLPLHPGLDEDDVKFVCQTLKKILDGQPND